MASSEFVAVTWNPQQLLDEDTLDQINNNILFLKEQSVDGTYMHLDGGIVSTGIKVLCGRKTIPARDSDQASATIGFATMFSPTCTPIVTTSIVAPGIRALLTHVIDGIGTDHPTHQGFQVRIRQNGASKKNDKINKPIYLNWIAMGY